MTIDDTKRLRLSGNFTLWEFIQSQKALEKGLMQDQLDIPEKYILNLKRLCVNILEPLRKEFKTPVKISSGYRSDKLNTAIGGSKFSDHMLGKAADIIVPGKMDLAFHFIKNRCNYKQLINELNLTWIHVSYDEFDLKNECLKTTDGQTYTRV